MQNLPRLTARQSVITGSFLLFLSGLVIAALLYTTPAKTEHVSAESSVESTADLLTTSSMPAMTPPAASKAMTISGTSSQVISAPKVTETPDKKAPIVDTTISAPQKPTIDTAELLSGHNAIRKEKGLTPLTWSSDLAKDAQAWSAVLQGEGCVMRHDYTSGYGENIYWRKQSGGNIAKMISDATGANHAWIEEEQYYDYSNNTCEAGKQCGHYTQIVWSETKEVGCGASSCFEDNSRTDIWVCRYDPHGNTIGQKPY